MGVDARRLEPGRARQTAEDQEGAGPRQPAALRVEEQLRPVALVEVRAPARQVAADGVDRLTPDRHDALLRALADAADDSLLEVHGGALESDGLADAQAGAVEELDERPVAEGARRRTHRGLDQPLGLARGERPRQ